MRQKIFLSMLLFLSIVAPFAAFADSFKITPVDLESGKTEPQTLEFVLDKSQEYLGFQATVELPTGITPVKSGEGLDMEIAKDEEDGALNVSSSFSEGTLKIVAFSGNHAPIVPEDGVILKLKVTVGDNFEGGTAKVKDIIFTNLEDKDVTTVGTEDAELTVKLTGLELSDPDSIEVGKTVTLTPTFKPANASNKNLSWESSNTSVATVANGVVTAKGAGTATITATSAANSEITATCKVTVVVPATGITLDKTVATIAVGNTANLTATVEPEGTTDKVVWTSSDATVATVENGVVTAVAAGKATITATAGSKSVTCEITVIDSAKYTIKYVVGEKVVTEEATGKIGEKITLTDTQKAQRTDENGLVYEWASDDSAEQPIKEDGKTIITVTYKNLTAKYTLKYVAGETVLKTVEKEGNVGAVVKLTTDDTKIFEANDGFSYKCVKNDLEDGATVAKGLVITFTCEVRKDGYILRYYNEEVNDDNLLKEMSYEANIGTPIVLTEADKADFTCDDDGITYEYVSDNSEGKVVTDGTDGINVICKAVTAEYTLNYVVGETIIKTEKKSGKVGASITIAATEKPEIEYNGKAYVYVKDDASGKKIAREGENVVTLTYEAKVIPVTAINLEKATATIEKGKTLTLVATVAPSDATNQNVTWTSGNPAVATVDATTGEVTAVAGGTATITATSAADETITATCTVTVTVPLVGISIDKELTLTEGDSQALTVTYDPEDTTVAKNVTWTSSDEAVATVDAEGNVKAVKAGTATITATVGDKSATCAVTVNAKVIEVEGITLSKTELSLTEGDESIKLTATVTPDNADDKTVTWTSSNPKVASVDQEGNVTALVPGSTVITAQAGKKTATCTVSVAAKEPEEGETSVPVKMTYVNYSDPDKAYGEIADGQTAESGYNKISGGSVGFGNTGWGVNYITYLQVNVSEIQGTILSAKLSFDASGSTDSKRTTTWGAGYNSAVWSSDMTYNTAVKSITTIGETASTSSANAGTFNNLSIDITDAILEADENGLITILLYETIAGGGYIKNPVVNVQWTTANSYDVTFKETNGADATVIVNKRNVSQGTSLLDGTYSFTATAKGYKDYEGEFTVAGKSLVVEYSMTPKDVWNWTLENNINDAVKTGTCFEGESATASYNRYILDNGTVWMKDAINKEYNYTFTPSENNYVGKIEYTTNYASDGIFFIEAEELEGMTETADGNAGVRASNAKGGYADEVITVCTLQPGTYKVRIASTGKADKVLSVKAGEEEVINTTTNGSWTEVISEEFTVSVETPLTFEGANAQTPLDYILITGTVKVPVTKVSISGAPQSHIYKGSDVQLSATVSPTNATDKTVTWKSSDESVATVDATGKVSVLHVGKVTITATADGKSASCTIKCYPTVGDADWSGEIHTNDAVEISNYVVGKSAAPADWKEDVHGDWKEYYEHAANVNGTGDVTFADASAAVMLALEQPMAEDPEQARISAYSSNATDALVVGRLSATADGSISVPLTLDNSMAYVALQADIILPEGVNVDVKAGSRAAGHTLMTKKFGDNRIRVSLFNLGNSAFADSNAPILEIVADSKLASADEIAISSIYASDSNAKEYTLSSRVDVSTEVEGIQLDGNASVKVYDLNGRYISDKVEGLAKGIYIIRQGDNAKKVNIK